MPEKNTKRAHLKIRGMTCASCAASVERSLSRLQGVASVEVNLGNESPTDNLWVSSSVRADRAAPLRPQAYLPRMQLHLDATEGTGHPSQTSLLQDNAESASPLPRRELAPEGAATPKVLRSVNGPPPPNRGVHPMDTIVSEETVNVHGHEFRRGFLRMDMSSVIMWLSISGS